MAIRIGSDFARNRPAHRPAAARQRDAGRRADGAAPRHVRQVDRSCARAAADGVLDDRAACWSGPRPSRRCAPELATVLLSAVGLSVVIAGKVSLGRSFGLMPANRGIVSTGLYRLVRHPIYMGYLITHSGFVAREPDAWNLCHAGRRRYRADVARGLRRADTRARRGVSRLSADGPVAGGAGALLGSRVKSDAYGNRCRSRRCRVSGWRRGHDRGTLRGGLRPARARPGTMPRCTPLPRP